MAFGAPSMGINVTDRGFGASSLPQGGPWPTVGAGREAGTDVGEPPFNRRAKQTGVGKGHAGTCAVFPCCTGPASHPACVALRPGS